MVEAIPGPDSEAVRAGYPRAELIQLVEGAEERFVEKIEEHGTGKNWIVDEPRMHVFKSVDEMMQARDHAQAGEIEGAMKHFQHALNHMVFALEITRDIARSGHDG